MIQERYPLLYNYEEEFPFDDSLFQELENQFYEGSNNDVILSSDNITFTKSESEEFVKNIMKSHAFSSICIDCCIPNEDK